MSILLNTLKGILRSRRLNEPAAINTLGLPPPSSITQQDGGGIICFATGSAGDALASLTRELIQPFAHRATRVWVLDLSNQNWRDELNRALEHPIWFAYSFFDFGQKLNIDVDGVSRNLWECCNIPFVRVFGDIPAYFPIRHFRNYQNSINGYWASSHFEFYRRWFGDQALAVKLPPIPISARPLGEVDKDIKMKGAILFSKNGNSPAALIDYWRSALPDAVAAVLESVGEECIATDAINKEPNIDDRIIRHFISLGIDVSVDRAILCFLVAQVDDYVRRIKSTMIAEAILDLPILVRGAHWEHVNFYGKKARLEPLVNYASMASLIDEAPAIIDMSPNISDAPHDRVWRAVGRGTAFLTNTQEYLGQFTSAPEKFAFDFNKSSIHDLVEHYVLNPKEAIDLGLAQALNFREIYTTEKYLQALLAAVGIVSLRLKGRPVGTQNFVDLTSFGTH